jgi:hypothetical protein
MRLVCLALFLAVWAACGGGPVLGNLPRPDPAVVAGAAAIAAGAATLANPNAAGKKPENENAAQHSKPVRSERMPSDVLDRLDKAEGADAGP